MQTQQPHPDVEIPSHTAHFPQPQPALEFLAHTAHSDMSADLHLPHPASNHAAEWPLVSLSGVVLGNTTNPAANANTPAQSYIGEEKASEPSEPDPQFFLKNWVGSMSPRDDVQEDNRPDEKYTLVDDLDSPEDNVPLALLGYFDRHAAVSHFNQ